MSSGFVSSAIPKCICFKAYALIKKPCALKREMACMNVLNKEKEINKKPVIFFSLMSMNEEASSFSFMTYGYH